MSTAATTGKRLWRACRCFREQYVPVGQYENAAVLAQGAAGTAETKG